MRLRSATMVVRRWSSPSSHEDVNKDMIPLRSDISGLHAIELQFARLFGTSVTRCGQDESLNQAPLRTAGARAPAQSFMDTH
jgi:hypothetical protein